MERRLPSTATLVQLVERKSSQALESSLTPACIWIDRNRSLGLKHQGFAFHIRDFFGNENQTRDYNENNAIMCKSGPRFRMYENLRAEDLVLIFEPPMEYTEDKKDKDIPKVINNPGVFAQHDENAMRRVCSDPDLCKDFTAEECGNVRPPGGPRTPGTCLGRKQERSEPALSDSLPTIDPRPSHGSAANTSTTRPFDGIVVISALPGHSAKWFCNNENTWDPSFAAIHENLFCDMENKVLYDICSQGQASCCFDLNMNRVLPCYGKNQRRGVLHRRLIGETRQYTKVHR